MPTQPDDPPGSVPANAKSLGVVPPGGKQKDKVFQPGDRVRVKTKHGSLVGVLQTVSELMSMLKLANGEMIEVETRRLRTPRVVLSRRKNFEQNKASKIDFRRSTHHKTVVGLFS